MTVEMAGTLLFALAVVALLLLMAAALLQSLLRRGSAQAGPWNGLLAAAAALAVLAALVVHVFVAQLAVAPLPVLFVLGVVALISGLAVYLLLERRAGQPGATDTPSAAQPTAASSPGLLSASIGFFTVMMTLFLPVLGGELQPAPAAAVLPTLSPTVQARLLPTITPMAERPTAAPTLTATPAPSLEPSVTASLVPSPSPTRRRYETPTPSPTPTVAPFCGALVDYNLNLRRLPSDDAAVLTVIPYQTVVQIGGQSEDGLWWFATYDDSWGWFLKSFVTADSACAEAPVLS